MGITKSISNQNNLTNIKTNDNKKSFDGLCKENVYGTYCHGVFDSEEVLLEIAKSLYSKKGLEFNQNTSIYIKAHKEMEYDKLADELRKSLDMCRIYEILNEGV